MNKNRKKNVWRLLLLLCLCLLPFSLYAQGTVIKRKPAPKPKKENKYKHSKQQTPSEKPSSSKKSSETTRKRTSSRLQEPTGHYSTEYLSDETITVNGVSFVMKGVQGGVFTMGATPEQGSDADSYEKPIHRVAISSFRIGQTEVTQRLWQAVMGSNPSSFKGDNRPVESVSWNDCQTFISRLNSLTGRRFRLPTEAEWEYAARGGNRSNGYKYAGSNNIDNVAWYNINSGMETHNVGTKSPNELGIYDMSGNVWEWCKDWYGNYGSSGRTNPTGPNSGSFRFRVYRGGYYGYIAGYCRVAYRFSGWPDKRDSDLGLRLAL